MTETPLRPEARRRPRGATFWVGVSMLLAGVVVLGWVGWQFWGTNWVAHRQQAQVKEKLQRQWTEGGTSLAPAYVPKGEASALVRVPKFGKSYAVPVLEGVDPDVLAQGFGHFEKTADPGQVGNYALAAHRVTHGEPLRRLPELGPGDQVIVETVDATYVYRLDTDPERLVIPFTGVWVLDPVPENPEVGGVEPAQETGQRLITLTTCSEIFHTDNRMIAFGHLVKVTPKQLRVERIASGHARERSRPGPGRRHLLPPDGGVHPEVRAGRVGVFRQVPLRGRPGAPGPGGGPDGGARPRGHRAPRRPRARRGAHRDRAQRANRSAGPFRAQGSQGVRHLQARRGAGRRRPPGHPGRGRDHHRGRRTRRHPCPASSGRDRRDRHLRHRPQPEGTHPLDDVGLEVRPVLTKAQLDAARS